MARWWSRVWAAALLSCLALLGVSAKAESPRFEWNAPESCERERFLEQVESLSQKKREAFDVEAEVRIASAVEGDWELTITTHTAASAEPARRAVRGRSCAEVMSAGAVAMAMTMKSAEATPVADAGDGAPAPTQDSPPATVAPPQREPPTGTASAGAQEPSIGISLLGGATLDTGALPKLAPGLSLEVAMRRAGLRAGVQGTLLAPTSEDYGGGASASFYLWALSPIVCGEPRVGRFALGGCAGYELGRMSGEGSGVSNPRLGSAFWQAMRFELSAAYVAGASFRLTARLGAAVPISRPPFVLDGVEVHKPAPFSLRALLGADFSP